MDDNLKVLNEKITNIDINDGLSILKLFRKLKKMGALINNLESEKIRLAVLGSHSIQYIVQALHLFLYKEGINAEIYEGEYDGIEMDVMNPTSSLYKFDPQIVLVMTYYTDIKELPALTATREEDSVLAEKYVEFYMSICRRLNSYNGCHILLTNFVVPLDDELGNLAVRCHGSRSSFYHMVNYKLCEKLPMSVTIVDMDGLASQKGKENWFDLSSYFVEKTGFGLDNIGAVTQLLCKLILASCGKIKKCLVLDLDNTLWGGVVGDEGTQGIQLDPNHPVGEAYRFFQKYILRLKNRGIVLAVCSKNDEAIAKAPFIENINMILKLDDISCFVANWDDKVKNIQKIADKLSLGLDSFVFFDDNPAERELVKKYLPMVETIDVPVDPAQYTGALVKARSFEWLEFSKEDINRTATYKSNEQRAALMNESLDYDEYLCELHMQGLAEIPREEQLSRFTQLINKSNQFNLRTQRYTESKIEEMNHDKNKILLAISLKDKFSFYGIISCVIMNIEAERCYIDTWVMSCRVLKRTVELFTFYKIAEMAKNRGCTELVGEYIKTEKNGQVEFMYLDLGFEKTKKGTEKETKGVQYVFSIKDGKIPVCPQQIQEVKEWD